MTAPTSTSFAEATGGPKIEKGVPLPNKRGDVRFAGFAVLDSAFFAGGRITYSGEANRWGRQQVPAQKFTARTVTENGVKGVRVWRIE